MKINEVMKTTGLTKKAIYYYEEEGLIKPTKEIENEYRVYTEKDLERLKHISALRKLDISVKDIKMVIDNPSAINNIMYNQLEIFNNRIQYLNKSKSIIENLIKDYNEGTDVCITNNLDKLVIYLDMDARACSGYMGKELERIFPGGFGRIMSMIHALFLDEPIDSTEKEEAWIHLVNTLDAMEEIKIPMDIKTILDGFADNVYKDNPEDYLMKNDDFINNVIAKNDKFSMNEKNMLDVRIEENKSKEGYQDLVEKTRKLTEFFKEGTLILPPEFAEDLKVLSSKYKMFSENILGLSDIKYVIAKSFNSEVI